MKKVTLGCALLHLLVDGLCVCCLYLTAGSPDVPSFVPVFITYNVLAFLTQPLTGMAVDGMPALRHTGLLLSVALLSVAVVVASVGMLLPPSLHPEGEASGTTVALLFAVAALLGMGNSLFHVWGGKEVAVLTCNDIRALGVFVATGAVGLAIGVAFASWGLLYGLLAAVTIGAGAVMTSRTSGPREADGAVGCGKRLPVFLMVAAMAGLMLFVALRSLLGQMFTLGNGYGGEGPTPAAVVVGVGLVSMVGKMGGGWLARLVGLRVAIVVMVVAVVACVVTVAGGDGPATAAEAMVGLFCVNLTMPVTLYLANVVLPRREGLAFGLLAAALMPGYVLAMMI